MSKMSFDFSQAIGCTRFPSATQNFHRGFSLSNNFFTFSAALGASRCRRPSVLPLFRESGRGGRRAFAALACLNDDQVSGPTRSSAGFESSFNLKKAAFKVVNELKGTSIFLVGVKNKMKNDVGKLLSELLKYCFFDSDSLVEQAAGGKVNATLFRERDVQGFRDSETEVLKQLSSMGRLVICAGDGAVGSSTNLAYLRHGISLWIDVPLDIVAKEATKHVVNSPSTLDITASESNPEVLANLTKQYEEIKGGYATADALISLQKVASQLGYKELEAVTTEEMTMEVLKEIEKLTRVKRMMEEAARPF